MKGKRTDLYEIAARYLANEAADRYLSPETVEDLIVLTEINRRGFITNDSQDGVVQMGNVYNDGALYRTLMEEGLNQLFQDEQAITEAGGTQKEVQDMYDRYFADVEKRYREMGGTYRKGIATLQRAYLAGVMEKERAEQFVHFFNMSDKVAYINRIPLTYQTSNTAIFDVYDNVLSSQVPISTSFPAHSREGQPADIAFELKDAGIPANLVDSMTPEELDNWVIVLAFDPTPGRRATGKDGLFTRVLRVLKMIKPTAL